MSYTLGENRKIPERHRGWYRSGGDYFASRKNIDFLFFKHERIRHEWHNAIECISNTEQQSNTYKRRSPHIRRVKDEGYTVIDCIRHNRFKQYIES